MSIVANQSPFVLSAGDIAQRFGVSCKKITRWAMRGGMPFERASGGIRRYSESACDEWFEKNRPLERKAKAKWPMSKPADDPRPGVIYAICHPITKEVRYIGKTVNGRTRYRQHLAEVRKGRHCNCHLQRLLAKWEREGIKPEFRVLQECLPYTLDTCECAWIAKGRKLGWKLCNHTDGGEGGSWTEERKRVFSIKITESNRRLVCSAKWIEGMKRTHAAALAAHARRKGMTLEQYHDQKEQDGARGLWRSLLLKYLAIHRKYRPRPRTPRQLRRRNRIVIDGGVAYVTLTKGQQAIIDAEDVDRVSRHSWLALPSGTQWRVRTKINSRKIQLNRFVLSVGIHQMVKHRNGNALDCRKENLTITDLTGYMAPQIAA